jgi:hypothetical protein
MMKVLDPHEIASVVGGLTDQQIIDSMPASARSIMGKESSGRTNAQNPHSTAFGAFQMIDSQRKHYMGADWQSTDLAKQYAAASAYVKDRYGSWDNAQAFWQAHNWY